MQCTLCRSGRESVKTLRRAQQRGVEWPEPNTGLMNSIQEPVVHTSFDDAFASMMQSMRISTRKCGRYHNSHRPYQLRESPSSKHTLRYHSPSLQHAGLNHRVTFTPLVHINTAPGTYCVTSAKTTSKQQETAPTTHVLHVKPGQSISLNFAV